MADPKFEWPDTAAPSVTLTFDRGELLEDQQFNHEFIGVERSSLDGTPFTTSLSDQRKKLLFTAILPTGASSFATQTTYINFIKTTLKNGIKKFDFTDRAGASNTVKLASGSKSINFTTLSEAFVRINLELDVL